MKKGLANIKPTMDGLKVYPCRFESVRCHRCQTQSESRVAEASGTKFPGFIDMEQGIVLCDRCKEHFDNFLVVFWMNAQFRLRVPGRDDLEYIP